MANLTKSRDDDRQEGVLIDAPHGENVIYAGAIVTVDSNGNAEAGETGKAILGVAAEESTKGENVRIYTEGVFQFDGAGFTKADVGKRVKIGADDHSVALATEAADASTGSPATPENQIVGKIVNFISATSVRVKL